MNAPRGFAAAAPGYKGGLGRAPLSRRQFAAVQARRQARWRLTPVRR